MKLSASFASLLAAYTGVTIDSVNGQTTYPCPAAGTTTILSASTTSSTTIRVPIISAPNGLCILSRRDPVSDTQRAPVARSFANQPWQHSPGIFARTGSGASVDCSAGSATECDVIVPPLPDGMEYILESYMYDSSQEAEAARFLEQVSSYLV